MDNQILNSKHYLVFFLTITNLNLYSAAVINSNDHYEDQDAIVFAALNRDLEKVKKLIYSGKNINSTDENGYTALRRAVFNNDTNMVELLIKSGANINFTSGDGYTALMTAARFGKIEMVKLLLNAGADTELIDEKNKKAINYADQNGFCSPSVEKNKKQIVEILHAESQKRILAVLRRNKIKEMLNSQNIIIKDLGLLIESYIPTDIPAVLVDYEDATTLK